MELVCKGKVETLYLLISFKRHAFLTSNYSPTLKILDQLELLELHVALQECTSLISTGNFPLCFFPKCKSGKRIQDVSRISLSK
jgi:hypothetical protein